MLNYPLLAATKSTEMPRRVHESSNRWVPLALCGCVAIVLVFSSGCGNARILRSDFNEYSGTPSGELLVGQIPGIPSGDRIENVIDFVAVTADAPLSGKSLRVDGQVDFVPASHEAVDRYIIDWEGMREPFENAPSTVSFLDDDGDKALELRFEDGKIHQITGDELEPPPFDFSGNFSHLISVTINTAGVGNVKVSVQQSNEDEPHVHANLKLLDNDFDELKRIRFEGTASSTYFINDLDVFTQTDE